MQSKSLGSSFTEDDDMSCGLPILAPYNYKILGSRGLIRPLPVVHETYAMSSRTML